MRITITITGDNHDNVRSAALAARGSASRFNVQVGASVEVTEDRTDAINRAAFEHTVTKEETRRAMWAVYRSVKSGADIVHAAREAHVSRNRAAQWVKKFGWGTEEKEKP